MCIDQRKAPLRIGGQRVGLPLLKDHSTEPGPLAALEPHGDGEVDLGGAIAAHGGENEAEGSEKPPPESVPPPPATRTFPDDKSYTGVLQAPGTILWSNNSSWTKVAAIQPLFDMNGRWMTGGVQGPLITVHGNAISIDMSNAS